MKPTIHSLATHQPGPHNFETVRRIKIVRSGMNLWRNELIAGVLSSNQGRGMGEVGCDCIPEIICLTLTSRPIDDVPRGTHLNPCPLDRSSCQQVRERSTWNPLSLPSLVSSGLRKAPMTNDLFSSVHSEKMFHVEHSLEWQPSPPPQDRELDPCAPSLFSSSFF
jgi:hypothetical protein